MSPRVVVTGMGVVSSNAHGLDEFESALRNGQSGIRHIDKLAEMGFKCQVGGVPQNIEPKLSSYFSEESLLAMNECMCYSGIASIDAWRDAKLEFIEHGDDRVHWDTGVIFGCGMGGMDTIVEKMSPKIQEGKLQRIGSTMVEQVMSSSVSAKIGGIVAAGGQVSSNSSACNTGTEAIIEGFYKIKLGASEKMLVGGVDGSHPYVWAGFDSMRVLNRGSNDMPEKASRPMSQTSGGFIPSAGAGALVLESLESAQKRNARIYTEILGVSLNSGGHRQGGSMTAPNPNGVQNCIKAALKYANLSGKEIQAINGHLTATFADSLEIKNWSTALGRSPEEMPYITATKSMIGHALGGAGAIESVASILQLHKGFLHGSINCEDLREELFPYEKRIVRKTREERVDLLAKASFGFGDVNGCLIFKRWNNGVDRK